MRRRGLALAAIMGLGMWAWGGDAPIAWIRFDLKTPEAQEYNGTPYVWLGRADIQLTIVVPPRPDYILELDWGAKNDTREGTAIINGQEVKLSGGGYDGFRPLRVPLPAKLTGERIEITLKPAGAKAGFIHSVRLLGQAAAEPGLDLKQPAHRIAAKITATANYTPAAVEAFPEMRAIWDGEPPAPAKPSSDPKEEAAFRQAEINGRRANEMFFRCHKFVEGWLAHADPTTGLIPRNLGASRDIWNAQDSAADNYPFMVLTAALTDRPLFDGRMLDMLRTETKLTSRLDRLPDTWSFSKQAFASEKPNLGSIIFGASEYVKDGLIPLTEWLGPSPWADRMLGILDDVWKHAPVETPYGKIPSTNVEVNGEQLQTLSRVYWMTGDKKYLEWAIRLGDYYLLGGHGGSRRAAGQFARHGQTGGDGQPVAPLLNFTSLRLRDHGCEILSGLCELYATVSFADPEKKKAYEKPIHEMCDRVLEVGRDEHGMLYNTINPQTGTHDKGICDTWGYNYNGIYTVYLIDKTEAYRDAVRHVLSNLKEHLTDYNWGSADEFADSVEGGINLYNREPVATAAEWLDSEIRDMWAKQHPDGVIEGWHGDGNSARTAIMYAFWKTQGIHVQPWRSDVRFGAVREGDAIYVSVTAGEAWEGKLVFDKPRHKVNFHLPLDWPRINQFPEWFAPEAEGRHKFRDMATRLVFTQTGKELHDGLTVRPRPGVELRLLITPEQR